MRIALLAESPPGDSSCQHRGNISPPLDGRWRKGGWTSHFEWPGTEAFLDVSGITPRARASWAEVPQCHDRIRQSFGDEIARVSKLPLMEHHRYVARMIDNGRKHGVKHTREPRGVTE